MDPSFSGFYKLVRCPNGPLSSSALLKHKRATELMFDVAAEHDLNVYVDAFMTHYWNVIRTNIAYETGIRIRNFKMLPFSLFNSVQPDLMMRLCPKIYFEGKFESDDFVRRLGLTPMLHEIHRRFKRMGIKVSVSGDDIVAEIPSEAPVDDTLCPITKAKMKCPVVASDGHTYEREAICRVIADSGRSPITREPLHRQVFPNFAMKRMIEEKDDAHMKRPRLVDPKVAS